MSDSNFVGGNYYGNQDGKIIASQIATSEHKVILSGGEPNPEYIYFAVPDGVSISSIVDHHGQEQIQNFDVYTEPRNIDETLETYVYDGKMYYTRERESIPPTAGHIGSIALSGYGDELGIEAETNQFYFGGICTDGEYIWYSTNGLSRRYDIKCEMDYDNCITTQYPSGGIGSDMGFSGDYLYYRIGNYLLRRLKTGYTEEIINVGLAIDRMDIHGDTMYYAAIGNQIRKRDLISGSDETIGAINFAHTYNWALKYNADNHKIYTTLDGDIYSYNATSPVNETLISSGIGSNWKDFSFDYDNDKIISVKGGNLVRMDYDGSNLETIYAYDGTREYDASSVGLENNWTLPYKIYRYNNTTKLTDQEWTIILQ